MLQTVEEILNWAAQDPHVGESLKKDTGDLCCEFDDYSDQLVAIVQEVGMTIYNETGNNARQLESVAQELQAKALMQFTKRPKPNIEDKIAVPEIDSTGQLVGFTPKPIDPEEKKAIEAQSTWGEALAIATAATAVLSRIRGRTA